MIITNSRYALVGYFITSYPTRAHGIIVKYFYIDWKQWKNHSDWWISNRTELSQGMDPGFLHGCGFILNCIGFDAVTPFVYTAPVEFVIRTGSFWKRFQKWSGFKTIRFDWSWKRRNRIDLKMVWLEQIWQLFLKPDHLVSHFNGIFY